MSQLVDIFGIENPVAIVTGSGSKRVGQSVARHLADLGYRIVVHANQSMDQAEALVAEFTDRGIEALAYQADLSDELAVQDMFDKIHWYFGRMDVLVNTAAIWKPKRLEEVTAADVREHFDTNALGTFLCSQWAGKRMVEQKYGGAIINFGDWATCRPYLDFAAYFPSKGAVEAMTRDFAVELGRRNPNVRVNAVLPGPVLLPDENDEVYRAQMLDATLTKRVGEPKYVAQAVAFLAVNPYITGALLPVDGGRSIYSAGEQGASR
jgi:pteridine reductase